MVGLDVKVRHRKPRQLGHVRERGGEYHETVKRWKRRDAGCWEDPKKPGVVKGRTWKSWVFERT